MPELTKEMYNAMRKEFTPKYKALFSSNLPEGTPFLKRLGYKLYGSDSAANSAFDDYLEAKFGGLSDDAAFSTISDFYKKASETPFNVGKSEIANLKIPLQDGSVKDAVMSRSPLGRTASTGLEYVKAHPGQTLGTSLNAGLNVAGLLDNDKLLGQAIGAAIGGIGGKALLGFGPLGIANTAMIGGNLGALFDTLRAKKEQEKVQAAQYGYGR